MKRQTEGVGMTFLAFRCLPSALLAGAALFPLLFIHMVAAEQVAGAGNNTAANSLKRPLVNAIISVETTAPELRSGGSGGIFSEYRPVDRIFERDSGRLSEESGIEWAFNHGSPDAAWSFDGERLAFHDGTCISIVDKEGKLTDRLFPSRGELRNYGCASPRWSHDGKRVVGSYKGTGIFDLRQRTADLLPEEGISNFSFLPPTFAPNDRFLVGLSFDVGGLVLVPLADPRTAKVIITEETRTAAGINHRFAPSGDRLARVIPREFNSSAELEILEIPNKGELVAATGGWAGDKTFPGIVAERIALIKIPVPIAEFDWAPNGNRLVSASTSISDSPKVPGPLWLLDAVTGKIRNTGILGEDPAWSPDGKYIAFDRRDQGIWLMDANASRPPWQLHPRGVLPRWSPQGDRIFILDPDQGRGEILVLSQASG